MTSSNTKRDVYLREMGLTPTWRLRGQENEHDKHGADAPRVATTEPLATQAHTRQEDPTQRATRIAALSWEALSADIAQCTACKLCTTRRTPRYDLAPRAPEWLLVIENDTQQKAADVARAEQLLDRMLEAVGKTRRENVLLTHVVQCHPPEHRPPETDEITACAPYLDRLIALAAPRVILALGQSATARLNANHASKPSYADIPVISTHHPAHLLQQPLDKAKAWNDLVAAQNAAMRPRE